MLEIKCGGCGVVCFVLAKGSNVLRVPNLIGHPKVICQLCLYKMEPAALKKSHEISVPLDLFKDFFGKGGL